MSSFPGQNRVLSCRNGLTLVEILVSITIVGLLVGLLLPAIQQSREAARRSQCANHLRQIVLAAITHHDQQGHFPTGGWGFAWVGIPDQGYHREQPGGWLYNLLAYMEQTAVHDLGAGQTGPERKTLSAARLRTPINLFNCPSRRSSGVFPTALSPPHLRNPRETDTVHSVARADYAANSGDQVLEFPSGPATIAEGMSSSYAWTPTKKFNGVCHWRSEVQLRHIVDGTAYTYYAGEKHLDPNEYRTGLDAGDNESMYNGYCTDLVRFGRLPPLHDKVTARVPSTDSMYLKLEAQRQQNVWRFGSAHPASCQMSLCDGSVQAVAYTIDREVHRAFCNRMDTLPVPQP